jgi:hypothetical protein
MDTELPTLERLKLEVHDAFQKTVRSSRIRMDRDLSEWSSNTDSGTELPQIVARHRIIRSDLDRLAQSLESRACNSPPLAADSVLTESGFLHRYLNMV